MTTKTNISRLNTATPDDGTAPPTNEVEQWQLGLSYTESAPRWQVTYDAVNDAACLVALLRRDIEHQDIDDRSWSQTILRIEQLLGMAAWGLAGEKGERLEIMQETVYGTTGLRSLGR